MGFVGTGSSESPPRENAQKSPCRALQEGRDLPLDYAWNGFLMLKAQKGKRHSVKKQPHALLFNCDRTRDEADYAIAVRMQI